MPGPIYRPSPDRCVCTCGCTRDRHHTTRGGVAGSCDGCEVCPKYKWSRTLPRTAAPTPPVPPAIERRREYPYPSRLAVAVGVAVVALVLGFALARHNYRECRAHDFGRLYCASTHLVR